MMLTGFGEAGSQYDVNVCGVPGMLSIFRLVDDTLKEQYRLVNWSFLDMTATQEYNVQPHYIYVGITPTYDRNNNASLYK